mmetsp:Transcript_33258/g.59894  ORF Transcript_33258/g.59894 Transcript_33258/m.59894 type:complete len:163 (+) Transcript_33258:123-611(+)
MTDLIVDFPQQRRSNSFAGSNKIVRKTVHFSPMNELRSFERNDNMNTGNIWYSDNEYKAMRIANIQAVQDVRRIDLSPSSNLVDGAEALEDCVTTGIENLLTSSITKKSKARRAQCSNAVLDEQERQDSSGEYDSIKLACVSNHYSKWSTRRARAIGMLQSQ